MKIRIVSAHVRADQESTWEGDVPLALELRLGSQASSIAVLTALYRYFSRLEAKDEKRLAEIGYFLPSMAKGDRVVLSDGTVWECEGPGWAPKSIGFKLVSSLEAPLEEEPEVPAVLRFHIDLPNPNDPEGEWVHFASYETRREAIRAAREYFGADPQGRISLITEVNE